MKPAVTPLTAEEAIIVAWLDAGFESGHLDARTLAVRLDAARTDSLDVERLAAILLDLGMVAERTALDDHIPLDEWNAQSARASARAILAALRAALDKEPKP